MLLLRRVDISTKEGFGEVANLMDRAKGKHWLKIRGWKVVVNDVREVSAGEEISHPGKAALDT